jgi:hypothetical protein
MSDNLWYCTPVSLNNTVENFEANCPANPNPTALSYNNLYHSSSRNYIIF